MRLKCALWAVVLLAAVEAIGCRRTPPAEQSPSPPAASARSRLASATPPSFVAHGDPLWGTVRRFYARRGDRLAWIDGTRPRSRFDAFLRALEKAPAHGLDPETYDLTELKSRRTSANAGALRKPSLDPKLVDETELRLTYAFLRYGSHLLRGRLDPEQVDPHWYATPRQRDLAQVLENAIEQGRVEQALEELAPSDPRYKALGQALARYRALAGAGGWPAVPPFDLRKQATAPAVAALSRRLSVEGDLDPKAADKPNVDATLLAGLKRFQSRHGLKEDGLLGTDTLAALNVPVADRIRQIELNLERWRWLPDDLGARHVIINVPAFKLDVLEQGQVRLMMRVVVGRKFDPTPIFSDQMTHVIFSPYWNVPESIVKEEILPALLKDETYLEREDMEVLRDGQPVDLRAVDPEDDSLEGVVVRQRPGPKNALGNVKFVFPNQFNVYLHDTPAGNLFAAEQRTFSHGCIRLEKPTELAQYVLRDQPQWSPQRIQEAMHSGREQSVPLKVPLPVHIVYWTAWLESDGSVRFRSDVYGHDMAHLRALAASQGRNARKTEKET